MRQLFAPPVKAPKAKAASQATPARAPNPLQRTPQWSAAGLCSRALPQLFQSEAQRVESLTASTPAQHQSQETDGQQRASSEITRSVSWDFSKVPVFAPNRPSHFQVGPPRLLQRKLAIGHVNDPLEHEADRVS